VIAGDRGENCCVGNVEGREPPKTFMEKTRGRGKCNGKCSEFGFFVDGKGEATRTCKIQKKRRLLNPD
jgi:hypothetical protein